MDQVFFYYDRPSYAKKFCSIFQIFIDILSIAIKSIGKALLKTKGWKVAFKKIMIMPSSWSYVCNVI